MKKIFFSNSFLDKLAQEGKISLEGNILTLMTADRPSFALEPSCRITNTAGAAPDPNRLVGRIMYEKDVKAMGAEIYLTSLIYRETAYAIELGYIGEKQELLDRLSDADMLAQYLINKLI